jgi:hypothetical protein
VELLQCLLSRVFFVHTCLTSKIMKSSYFIGPDQ